MNRKFGREFMQPHTLVDRMSFCIVVILATIASQRSAIAQKNDSFRDARYNMVSEFIEREGITNSRVLESMRQVPRHEFCMSKYRKDAYFDCALPIGSKQTISPPYIVAYMTDTIDPQPTDRVLEIGTGSGYQAAVLSNLVKEVYSIEIVEPLGKAAAERLHRLKYSNVKTKVGDGYLGWEENAPFDKIIVTCSPEKVPQPLVDQLKEGGKLLVPLGERYQQVFHIFEKKEGKLVDQRLISTLFVPMTGQSEANRRVKPDALNPTIVNGNFELDDNKDGFADHWHYQRLTKWVDQDAPEGKHCILFESHENHRISQALQAMALNGARIGNLEFTGLYKVEDVTDGTEPSEQSGMMVHFYDENRHNFQDVWVSNFSGNADWNSFKKTIPVPAKAREMIVRIGLNGAVGKLWLDNLRVSPIAR